MTLPALLTYSFLADPDPIQASSAETIAYAALNITVENATHRAIQVTSIAIGLAVGTNAKDFAAGATGIGTVAPSGWNATVSGDSLVLTPHSAGAGRIAGGSITCLFTGIPVNAWPGQAILPITEITVVDGAPRTGTGALTVVKVPPQFTLGPLTVLSPNSTVVAGNPGILQWAGGTADYSLSYNPNPGPTVTVPGLPQIDTFTTVPLEMIGLMGFTLNVNVPIPGSDQTLQLQRTAQITVVGAVPVITSLTGVVQDGQASLTWTTENAVSCAVDGSALVFGPSGTAPFLTFPHGSPKLTAFNADGVASAPAYLSSDWSLVSVTPMPVDQFEMTVGPDGRELYLMGNGMGHNPGLLMVVTPAGVPVRQTNLGQPGFAVLFSPDGTRLYAALASGIVAIDPRTLAVVATAAVPGQASLAISADGRYLYSTPFSGTQVYRIDTTTMTVTAQAPFLGAQNEGQIALSYDGSLLFGFDNDNARCVVWTAATLAFIKTIGVDSNAQGIAASPTLPEIYVTTNNSVNVIDTSQLAVVAVIPAGSVPTGLAVTSDGTRLFVGNANWMAPAFTMIDTARRVVMHTTAIGTEPNTPVFSPADSRFYSTIVNSDSVQMYEVSTLTPPSTA